MKTHHLFWGIFFLVIGALIFIDNYTSLSMDWDFIINLWPAILVVIGVSIIVRNSKYRWILAIISSLLLSVIIFSVYKNIAGIFDTEWQEDFQNTTEVFSESFTENTKIANLYIQASVGNFQLNKTTNNLIDINTKGSATYTFERDVTDGKADIYFEQEEEHFRIAKGWFKKQVSIKLNTEPVWDMDFDIGGSKAELDLSSFRIEDLYFKTGVSSIKLKIGDKQDSARVRFNTGVSQVKIFIPKGTGCLINTRTDLTKKKFDDFQKVDDHTYRSDNYYNTNKKVFLDMESDLSSIRVDYY